LCAFLRETAGHAVTVGIGSSSGATDVLPPYAITASTGVPFGSGTFAEGWFSSGSTQALFLTSASWGSASINAEVFYLPGN
jgi:hypothetical protein